MIIRPFRFWSQKVLPLVYDDSLSYYEVLAKLVRTVNNMIEEISNNMAEYLTTVLLKAVYDEENEEIAIQEEES